MSGHGCKSPVTARRRPPGASNVAAVELARIDIGGDPEAWAALGFSVESDQIALGNGALVFVDGPPAVHAVTTGEPPAPAEHPNGALHLDHVVYVTPSLEAASAEITETYGLPQRRIREVGEGDAAVRQAFHRFPAPAPPGHGPGCIVEIVQSARTQGRPGWFGLVVVVADLVELCAELGPELIGTPKAAVQPGRQIATVRRSAGLGFPVALMTPDP